jgi:hypothetical protein
MEVHQSNYYYIKSSERIFGDIENGLYNNANYDRAFAVRLSKVQIPYTYYNVTSNNNTVVFDEGGGNITVTITAGQYTLTQFLSALKTALDASAGTGVFTITAGTNTYKVTIASTVNFIYRGTLSTINRLIGFANTDTTSGASHTGTKVYNMGGTNYIDILSNYYSTHGNRIQQSNLSGTNIIARIPVSNYSFGETIYYQSFVPHILKIKKDDRRNIDLILHDEFGNQLDLNGQEWYIQFKYHTEEDLNENQMKHIHQNAGIFDILPHPSMDYFKYNN